MSNENKGHFLASFDDALTDLQGKVLVMASLTERSLERAMKGLLERDANLCNVVIAEDEEIDQLEKDVDRSGMELIFRFQPVARDLRRVISAMRLSGNLERIADQSVSIARKARRLNQLPKLEQISLLAGMYQKVHNLLKDSMRAYTDGDVALAMEIKPRDKEIDQDDKEIGRTITEVISETRQEVESLLSLIFIARHLERIADHATNIAEDAVFAEAAQDIRHTQGQAVE